MFTKFLGTILITAKELLRRHPGKTLLVAGALSCFAAPPLYIFTANLVGVVIVSLWLQQSDGWRLWRGLLWFFFAKTVVGLYWLTPAPVAIYGVIGWLLGGTFVVLLSIYFVALYGVCLLPLLWLRQQWQLPRHLALAALWLVASYLQAQLFTGFPWQLPGYEWGASLYLINSSAVWGIHGVSFAVVLSNILLAFAIVNRSWSVAGITLLFPAACLLAGLWNLQQAQAPSQMLPVTIIQPNVAQDQKWSQQQVQNTVARLISLSKEQNNFTPQLIVWPETALPFPVQPGSFYRQLQSSMGNQGFLLTGQPELTWQSGDSASQREIKDRYNSLILIDAEGQLLASYRKHHLVPFGEYVPFRAAIQAIAGLFGGNWSESLPQFSAGTAAKIISVPGLPAFTPLICYEGLFPLEFLLNTNPRQHPLSKMLVMITNDAWYLRTAGPHQHLAINRVRAIEQGLPMVRSANTGISAAFDAFGRELDRLSLNTMGRLDIRLPIQTRALTPFSYWGNRLFYLALGILLAWTGLATVLAMRREP